MCGAELQRGGFEINAVPPADRADRLRAGEQIGEAGS